MKDESNSQALLVLPAKVQGAEGRSKRFLGAKEFGDSSNAG